MHSSSPVGSTAGFWFSFFAAPFFAPPDAALAFAAVAARACGALRAK